MKQSQGGGGRTIAVEDEAKLEPETEEEAAFLHNLALKQTAITQTKPAWMEKKRAGDNR